MILKADFFFVKSKFIEKLQERQVSTMHLPECWCFLVVLYNNLELYGL